MGYWIKDVNGNIFWGENIILSIKGILHAFGTEVLPAFFRRCHHQPDERNNYYLDNSLGIGWGRGLVNGLAVWAFNADMARKSLASYKTYRFMDSIFYHWTASPTGLGFWPLTMLFYGTVELLHSLFSPTSENGTKKIILESKWPTVYLKWRKEVPQIFQ